MIEGRDRKAESCDGHQEAGDDKQPISQRSLSPSLGVFHIVIGILSFVGAFISAFYMILNLVFAPCWLLAKAVAYFAATLREAASK